MTREKEALLRPSAEEQTSPLFETRSNPLFSSKLGTNNSGLIIESSDYSLQQLLLAEFQNTFTQRFVHFCVFLISAVRLPISLTSATRHRALVPVFCVPLKIVFSSLLFDLSPFIILQFCVANYRNGGFISLKAR